MYGKYKVGEDEAFGISSPGDIIEGIILAGNNRLAMLYFPPSEELDACGSLCIGHKKGKYWTRLGSDAAFLNIERHQVTEMNSLITELHSLKMTGA